MGEAFLYGNSWSESSGKIVTVHVFYRSSVNVTCTNGKKTYTGITDANYNAIFKLPKGIWTITAEKDGYTSSINVNVSEDCTVNMSIFHAIINITYPTGSTCTATDGVTTLIAPDKSGIWECNLPNAGTWTVSLSNGFHETISIEEGEMKTINKWYLYNVGDERVYMTGGIDYHSMVTYSEGGAYPKGIVTKNEKNIYLYNASGSRQSPVATNSKIDVSTFTKLCARISGLKQAYGGYHHLGLYSAYHAESKISVINLSEGIVKLDISGVKDGNYYVAVVLNSSSSDIGQATIHEIWLE